MRKTLIAGALILGTTLGLTSATLAQGYYGGRYEHGFSYRGGYNYGPSAPNVDRGGPGPRVQGGSGTGVGAER